MMFIDDYIFFSISDSVENKFDYASKINTLCDPQKKSASYQNTLRDIRLRKESFKSPWTIVTDITVCDLGKMTVLATEYILPVLQGDSLSFANYTHKAGYFAFTGSWPCTNAGHLVEVGRMMAPLVNDKQDYFTIFLFSNAEPRQYCFQGFFNKYSGAVFDLRNENALLLEYGTKGNTYDFAAEFYDKGMKRLTEKDLGLG
tara:strand:- start:3805 stop:4407 length:603 start_codon:yes stop_codon:yes gene_type:complete